MTENRGGALEGIRVIDLTQMLAGPYCTQMLADQGADVIKIEPPQGDSSRKLGPYRADDQIRRTGGYFASVNRNKKSIVIDLKSEDGRALLRRLVRTADVWSRIIAPASWIASACPMNRCARTIRRWSMRRSAGFGDPRTGESPYVDWPAFDVVAQAMGGLMGITGPDAKTPIKVGPGLGDIVPGAFAATGILAALAAREDDRTRPVRRYLHGGRGAVGLRAHRASAQLCRRGSRARRQPASDPHAVRRVPGVGRFRQHRRADR